MATGLLGGVFEVLKQDENHYSIKGIEQIPTNKAYPYIWQDSKGRLWLNEELQKMVERTKKAMEKAATELDFMEAARLRDEYLAVQKMMDEKK